jgi:diguanylate cyclase (GGDEF)-like protein/PAS domain S-box-containing protein
MPRSQSDSLPAPLSAGSVDESSLLALVADWVWATDASLRVIQAQPLQGDAGRLSWLASLVGRRPWESDVWLQPDGRTRRRWRPLWRREPFRGLELQWRSPRGELSWTSISGLPRRGEDGRFLGYTGVAVDITARKRAEMALHEARAELDATLRALPDLMFEIDADGIFRHVHAPRPEWLYVPAEQIVGRHLRDLLPPAVADLTEAAMAQALREGQAQGYRYHLTFPSGKRWFECSMACKVVSQGTVPRFIALVRDVTELKAREAELQALAFYDPLTALPNRRLLFDRIEQVLLRQQRDPVWVALLFVDLDDFKSINDTWGHEAGDAVLVELSARLRAMVRAVDPVGRLGGDEFVVLLTDLGARRDRAMAAARRIGRTLLSRLSQPVPIADRTVSVSVSVGGLLFRGGHALPDLLAAADRLMYTSKQDGKGRLTLRPIDARVDEAPSSEA